MASKPGKNGVNIDADGSNCCSTSSLLREEIGVGDLSVLLFALPQVKAAPDFEQKLAARMSIELEEEAARRNRSLLRKKRVSQFRGRFFVT